MSKYKLSIVEEICAWKSYNESEKLYFIKSYLTGWTSEDQIHALTEVDKKAGA